jgi:transposase
LLRCLEQLEVPALDPAPPAHPGQQDVGGLVTAQLARVSGKSALAEAIRYALRHRQRLVLFLEDGRVELDTNTIERAIQPITLGRKNGLFAGSDVGARHWAVVASLGRSPN